MLLKQKFFWQLIFFYFRLLTGVLRSEDNLLECSPSTMWVLEIKLRFSGLGAGTFTQGTFLYPQNLPAGVGNNLKIGSQVKQTHALPKLPIIELRCEAIPCLPNEQANYISWVNSGSKDFSYSSSRFMAQQLKSCSN